MKTNRPTAWIVLSLCLLQACGGGGGGSSNGVNGDGDGDDNPGNNLNGDLTGNIFIGNNAGPWILDLATGHYTPIPGTNWEDNPDFPSLADFSAYPLAFSGAEFIQTVENCVIGANEDNDCIVFHVESGQETGRFELPDTTSGPARLSRDGQLVGVVIENENRGSGDPFKIVQIFERDGTLVETIDNVEIDRHDFDWLPDDRIVYTSGQSLYISGQTAPILTIPDNSVVLGEPAVSPEGAQVAFTIGEDTSTGVLGTIWVVDVDGNQLRQLTEVTTDNTSTLHRTPVWSPDGRWIFVIDQTSIEGNAFAVPSEGERVELTQGNGSQAVPVLSFFRETITNDNDPISASTQFTVRSGSIAWLP